MAWSEVYTALQQKTIDGQENPVAIIYHQKIYEVQKYLALTGHFYSPTPVLMSLKAFNALPKNIQTMMIETALECATYERNLLRDSEAKQLAEIKAKGVLITTPPKKPFQEAAASVYKDFREQFGQTMIDKIINTR
jgi:TRAP-type C4-dicarboxylate transport system substrate-binding protein